VSNITKPGKHVFQFEASDGASTASEQLTVPVYPVNSAPVIHAARAAPALQTPPEGTPFLSATTGDPDGDTISHWWRMKKGPAGANIAFAKQGSRDTKVEGLSLEGTYVFELTVVDRTQFVTEEVAVTVAQRQRRDRE